MAKQFTGIDGALYADGKKVARVADWSITANAEALETTSLGDFAANYMYGRQSFTGSCTLFYYEDDAGKINGSALLTDVFRTTRTPEDPIHTMDLRFDGGASTRRLSFKVLIQNAQMSASVGSICQAQISFTVCGPLTAATFA